MPRRSMDVSVDSSVIGRVTYEENATLTVRLRNGAVYRYFLVPHGIVQEFLAAPSKGAYFNRHIREGFPCQRVVAAGSRR